MIFPFAKRTLFALAAVVLFVAGIAPVRAESPALLPSQNNTSLVEWPDPWIQIASYRSREFEKLQCLASITATPEDCRPDLERLGFKYTSREIERTWRGHPNEAGILNDLFNVAQSEEKITTAFTKRYSPKTSPDDDTVKTCVNSDIFKDPPFSHTVSDTCSGTKYSYSSPDSFLTNMPAVTNRAVTRRIGGGTVSENISGTNIRKQYSIAEQTVFRLIATKGDPSVTYSIPLQANASYAKVLRAEDGFVDYPGGVPCEKISIAGKALDSLCKVRAALKGKGSLDITPRVASPYYWVWVDFDATLPMAIETPSSQKIVKKNQSVALNTLQGNSLAIGEFRGKMALLRAQMDTLKADIATGRVRKSSFATATAPITASAQALFLDLNNFVSNGKSIPLR